MIHARSDYNDRIVDLAGLIPDDEPVLVVRGQDQAAPATARAWADEHDRLGGDPTLSAMVREHAVRIEEYQARTGRSKVADLPATAPSQAPSEEKP